MSDYCRCYVLCLNRVVGHPFLDGKVNFKKRISFRLLPADIIGKFWHTSHFSSPKGTNKFMITKLTHVKGRDSKGLTLIELLITIAVIGIVSAITLPVITSVVQQAQIDAHKAEMLLTRDSIQNSINAMGGIVDTQNSANFNLGTSTDYKRYEAAQPVNFRFDINNPEAIYTVTPSRITRLVPEGDGTVEEPYTGFCITAWVGDVNLELVSGSSEANEGSCGLIPGPITKPDAPDIGEFLPLSNTVAVVNYTAPTGENRGGRSEELLISEVRVTCNPTTLGDNVVFEGAFSNPVQMEGLEENVEYYCTVAVKNNADPNWSDESLESNSATMFTTPSAPVSALGSNGPTMNISWGAPEIDGGDPIIGYVVRYVNVEDITFDPTTDNSNYDAQAVGGFWNKDYLPFSNATGPVGELIIPNAATLLYGITGNESSESNPVVFSTSALGLTPGQAYHIAIAAYNNAGGVLSWSGSEYTGYGQFRLVTNSSTFEGFIRTATQPDNILLPPGDAQFSAQGGNDSENIGGTNTNYYFISMTWNKPYDGGSPIIRYEVQYDVQPDFLGNASGDGPLGATSKTISGPAPLSETVTIGSSSSSLPSGTTYFLRARACNAITSMGDGGCGEWIASGAAPAGVTSAATPSTPTAPSNAEAEVSKDGTATVTWTN
jgi:prepilin-type N-terminal cleavage/methylation domain-containing protein